MWRNQNTIGGNEILGSCYGKQHGGSSKKVKLSHDPAIPSVGTNPKESKAGT